MFGDYPFHGSWMRKKTTSSMEWEVFIPTFRPSLEAGAQEYSLGPTNPGGSTLQDKRWAVNNSKKIRRHQYHCWTVSLKTLDYWTVFVRAQSCPTLCDPMDWSLSGSLVHGIFQARMLEQVAISSTRGIFMTQGLNPSLLCLLHW